MDIIVDWVVSHIVGIWNWFVSILTANAGLIGTIFVGGIVIFLLWSLLDDI